MDSHTSHRQFAGHENRSPFQGAGRGRVPTFPRRAGFTLVELMMSLIIIGLLTTLLGVAVNYALIAAKNTAIKADIANLDQALQQYKNSYGSEYPSCMAIPAFRATTSIPSRYELFNRTLRKRFPRYTNSYMQTWQNTGAANPDVAYTFFNTWNARNLADPNNTSSAIPLNLDNLDPAEALVFWLAGPPAAVDPTTNLFTTNSVLWGFCANPTTPLAVRGSRAPSLYDFDEARLTDVDHDGWPEYTPTGSSSKTIGNPPYVYFEPNSFSYTVINQTFEATYPGFFQAPSPGYQFSPPKGAFSTFMNGLLQNGTVMKAGGYKAMLDEWGFAVPYASNYVVATGPTQGQVTFWAPKKFQLICAGLDHEYGGSQYEQAPDGSATLWEGRPYTPVVPQTASENAPPFQSLTHGDNDNLTNFIDTKIEDYVP